MENETIVDNATVINLIKELIAKREREIDLLKQELKIFETDSTETP